MNLDFPLITKRQAYEIIGQERFDHLLKHGFIKPGLQLKGIEDAEVYDKAQVESAPFRAEMSYKCWVEWKKMKRNL